MLLIYADQDIMLIFKLLHILELREWHKYTTATTRPVQYKSMI